MNPQEVFEAWKARKSQYEGGREFAEQVMATIRRREATRAAGGLVLLRHVTARPWARAVAIIMGALLGLARIIATIHLVLSA